MQYIDDYSVLRAKFKAADVCIVTSLARHPPRSKFIKAELAIIRLFFERVDSELIFQ